MTEHGFRKSDHPLIGREYPPSGEVHTTNAMVTELKAQLIELYPAGEMKRQAHSKLHGLLKARFVINPELADEHKIGVFGQKPEYDCFIRFSNASTSPKPDIKPDVRGMAIKLVGVDGDKLLASAGHAETQDFVLISHEVFVSKSVKQFGKLMKHVAKESKLGILGFMLANPGVLIRTLQSFIKTGSVLDLSYYSTTPYQFENENRAVKYKCVPQKNMQTAIPTKPNNDYLRYQLTSDLSKEEVRFDFFLQFQEDANTMPIEDPTVAWTSVPVKVATIIIPTQTFDNDIQNEYGNQLSFSPWHSLTEHRPIGGFNRARRIVYEELSKFRLEQNGQEIIEPTNIKILGLDKPNEDPAKSATSNMNTINPEPSPVETISNSDVVKQLFICYGKGDIPGLFALFDANIVWNEPGAPDVPYAGIYNGIAGLQKMFGLEHEELTVRSFNPISFLTNDTMVTVLGNDTTLVKDTGKEYTTDWCMAFTIANNLITNVKVYMDTNAVAKAFIP